MTSQKLREIELQLQRQTGEIRSQIEVGNYEAASILRNEMKAQDIKIQEAVEGISKDLDLLGDDVSQNLQALGSIFEAGVSKLSSTLEAQLRELEDLHGTLKNARRSEAQELTFQGLRLAKANYHEDAAHRFREALQNDQTDYFVLISSGVFEAQNNNLQDARDYFERAAKIPDNCEEEQQGKAFWAAAMCLSFEDPNRALANAREGAKRPGTSSSERYLLALLVSEVGEPVETVIQLLAEAIRTDSALFQTSVSEPRFARHRQAVLQYLDELASNALGKLRKPLGELASFLDSTKSPAERHQLSQKVFRNLDGRYAEMRTNLPTAGYRTCLGMAEEARRLVSSLPLCRRLLQKEPELNARASAYKQAQLRSQVLTRQRSKFNTIVETLGFNAAIVGYALTVMIFKGMAGTGWVLAIFWPFAGLFSAIALAAEEGEGDYLRSAAIALIIPAIALGIHIYAVERGAGCDSALKRQNSVISGYEALDNEVRKLLLQIEARVSSDEEQV